MTIEQINLGNYANDGTGDDLRTAFQKINANFDSMSSTVNIINGTNLGSGTALFAQKLNANLEFKTLTSTDNSVTITNNATTVNLKSTPNIIEDTTPQLGGDLGLNGHFIKMINGGGVESKIWGIDVPLLNSLVELMLTSNQFNIDFGGFAINLVNTNLDMGQFVGNSNFTGNTVDFGSFV